VREVSKQQIIRVLKQRAAEHRRCGTLSGIKQAQNQVLHGCESYLELEVEENLFAVEIEAVSSSTTFRAGTNCPNVSKM